MGWGGVGGGGVGEKKTPMQSGSRPDDASNEGRTIFVREGRKQEFLQRSPKRREKREDDLRKKRNTPRNKKTGLS